ncbi:MULTISPECIES: hypothetical protein [unclassified Microcystis]|uniref:hypothetical protein n=1 Tax=unclassified Microcystis TaxID=2643300 RepID=UPI00119138C2|nr:MULTISPECIES: hypothetical protein [unclassified Microcystis]MCA2680790.1 hypothetical protein [Microcystis sp. M043S2]MCA2810738.1 hypothetical protein [Microcystis sp. M095S1]MCA2824261.1 hypothetical protein [Microcystis sp. M088S1]MCA2862269.1 hypothetical protein [Microcystis sp. M049S1]MCA2913810.1 hypothetical protein [Microcystis sp. M022S1]MCA2935683.1 hypothetical protein [Microcystis sp. M015S1]MCA2956216.1 hypothetical protein [Microcystis sp. M010S1]
MSQSVEKILISFFDQSTFKEKLDRQTLQKAIELLSSLVGESLVSHQVSESLVSHQVSESLVSHQVSDTPHRESKSLEDHPDTVLQYLYGVVLVEDKKIKGFWDGRKYHDDPNRLKIYKAPPQTRVMSKAEIEASYRGQARWNDLFKLLELLGYPHGFSKWKTVTLEKKWVNSNLDS